MSWVSSYIRSSVGAKHIMAITGLMLSVFVLIHMLGNLLVFAGQDAMNDYAVTLQGMGALLWVARLGLLGAVALHIASGLRLAALNRAARPVKYKMYKPVRSPFYARAMMWSGLALLFFIIYHLLHFTFGAVQPETYSAMEMLPDGTARHDVYSMVVLSFQVPAVAASYVVAMAFLCMHLAHGMSSFFQSLGLNHPKYNNVIRYVGPVYAGIIFTGNTLIPLAILAGMVKLPGA